ncbi:lysozyme inhibitor LprI family protein [Larkinella bovis]|uniref:Lysozyme inhibitor LprI family protein n=1 Tax=Larkinella bovis TaxID=683041 RepID=A0ABW0IFV0_9BACT
MRTKYIGTVVSCLMAIGTWAQPPGNRDTSRTSLESIGHPPEVFTNCDNAQTQTELNLCAQMRFQKADLELNTVYRQLLTLLPKEDKSLVMEAQRQWIAYRDTHCKVYEKMYAGGSMLTMVVATCKETTTLSRINELKELIAERKLRP